MVNMLTTLNDAANQQMISAHERLHSYVKKKDVVARQSEFEESEEIKRRKAALERSFSEHRKSQSIGQGNPPNRLYEDAMRFIVEKQRKIEANKRTKAVEELKDCTFKPKFISKAVVARKNRNEQLVRSASISHDVMKMPQPRHEELFMVAQKKEQKLQKMRYEKQKREIKSLDFKPQISQKSRDMVKQRLTECTFQSAAQLKRVQQESLCSSLLSNLFKDKTGI